MKHRFGHCWAVVVIAGAGALLAKSDALASPRRAPAAPRQAPVASPDGWVEDGDLTARVKTSYPNSDSIGKFLEKRL